MSRRRAASTATGDLRTSTAAHAALRPDTGTGAPVVADGALSFLTLAALWTLWTLVLPLALLLPLSYQYHDDGTVWGVRAAMVAMIVTGVVYLAYQLSPLVFGPHTRYTAPPAHGPLASTTTEPRPAYQITVKRVVAIVNPYGGGGRNRRRWEREALLVLRSSGVHVDTHYTQHYRHGKQLCRTLSLTGYDCLVVVGGDNTFHECINGLLTRTDRMMVPVALVPGGTCNSLATDLGSLDWRVCIDRIVTGKVCYIDVNHVTTTNQHGRYPPIDEYSIQVFGWGQIAEAAAQSEAAWMRALFGPVRADLCGVWCILKGYQLRLRIQIYDSDDRSQCISDTTTDCVTAFINTTQYFAKGLRAAPLALLDDGKFDLVVVDQVSRVDLLALFTVLGSGSHTQSPSVQYHQTCKVRITPLSSGTGNGGGGSMGKVNIDGENRPYEGTIQIECLHKLLPLVITI